MKRKKLQKVVSVLLCTAMLLSMVACGSTEESEGKRTEVGSSESTVDSEKESGSKEAVELTYYPSDGANGTDEMPWLEELLTERCGAVLRNRAMGDGVVETMVSSGDLTDLTRFQDEALRKTAIEAGLLVDLSQYKEQLPNIFENEFYDAFVAYEMDLYGGVYGLPCGTGDKGGFVAVPDFRWDVYKEVGYPEINTMDDLLETLKQMQDACPETEDGSKVYGIGLFSNWDGATPYLCHEMYYGLLGYRTIYSVCTVPVDLSSDVEYMLEDDSQLYNALKYFYKANQMGILDPDSPANTYDAYAAKASAGGYLMPVWNWHRNLNSSTEENIEKGIGFQSLLANAFTLSKAAYAPMGNGWRMCVSANSDHLDAALAFLNYVYSFEGQEEISNGVEGVLYEYDENGTRVMTEDYKAVRNAGGDRKELVTVENYWDQTLFMGGFHGLIYPSTINTNTGAPIGIDEQYPMYGTTALEEDWYSVYGQVTVNEYSMKGDEAEFASIVEVSPAFSFLPTMSEEMSELYSGFKSVMNTACWKMIFAADEAEFEALWTQLQKDAESVGLEQIAVAAQEALDQAVSSIDKYTK